MENSNTFKINIFDLKTGLKTYDNVEYVRITSKDYNLLIMVDYVPIIGEITGNIDIQTKEGQLNYKNIKASYMNSNNIFNLMIQGEINE